MKSKVVAILESRTGEHMGEMIARRGGIPLLAPALAEVPDVDPAAIPTLFSEWRSDPYRVVIFQTGVGTRALFEATETRGQTGELLRLLAEATVVVRGPKPTGELSGRGVRIDVRAATPFTTETVLAGLSAMDLKGVRILVQRYGSTNKQLLDALAAAGARVEEIVTYKWALPADVRPLLDLLEALAQHRVDAVVFTSAVQIHNLYAVAATDNRSDQLATLINRTVVASIGPVCSRALRGYGINPSFEASPPKLGPLLVTLDEWL